LKRGKSLYDFWGTTIADTLNADMADHADQTIVNLASNEYFKAVDKKAMTHPVITAKFLNVKDGKARALMYYAKYGRGLMARWIMQNRVDRADLLRAEPLRVFRARLVGDYQKHLARNSQR